MKIFRLLTFAGAALFFISSAAAAGPFTFADDRCRDPIQNSVICNASTEDTTLANIVGLSMTFEEFVSENKSLSRDATPETKAPAFRMYVIRVRP